MKTKGLTFLEAVVELQAGRCREITCGRLACICTATGVVDSASRKGIIFTPEEYTGDWNLIGAVQKLILDNTEDYSSWAPPKYFSSEQWNKFKDCPTSRITFEWVE